jgi:hypothetical protein
MAEVEEARANVQHVPNVLAAQQPQQQAFVSSGPVHVPEFWIDELELWFARVEASFRSANVTSPSTKFDYVLMKLPMEVLKSVRSVIQTAPADGEDIYERLKSRLLSSHGRSKWKLANQLLDHPALGDNRPSALMDSMLAILPPGEQAGVVFLAMFLRRLPTDLRDHLAGKDFASPQQMAEHADTLWDARAGASGSVSHVARSRESLPTRGRRRSPGRSPRGSQQTPGPGGLCFYPHRFKARAHKCVPPCSWAENDVAAGTN